MRVPTHTDSFRMLLLQAADEGRGAALFGESQARANELVPPFLVSQNFPDVYLEHPLIGEPFLDVTVLYGDMKPGTRINSPAAGEHGAMLDWYADARKTHHGITCGFELDTKEKSLPAAAIHFQPREFTELVRPFCEAIGEPERAELYLTLTSRMPNGWPLSFFGMFRGRPGSPLRVCGYLDKAEKTACANDKAHLAQIFNKVGFAAFNDTMLTQIAALMAATPMIVDFQFDVYPDGSLGNTFAIDIQFGIEQPEVVYNTFENGPGARIMSLLESWGAADNRWKLGPQAAFARSVPVELPDGGFGRFAFSLMPQWVKARWTNGTPQPSKLYHLAHAGLLVNKAG
ncbi:MAG: hypothetical protein IKE43_03470 [Coriobacteriales bacterium]|nr:hypothetical protein [Coriobacteriales bacterium]